MFSNPRKGRKYTSYLMKSDTTGEVIPSVQTLVMCALITMGNFSGLHTTEIVKILEREAGKDESVPYNTVYSALKALELSEDVDVIERGKFKPTAQGRKRFKKILDEKLLKKNGTTRLVVVPKQAV